MKILFVVNYFPVLSQTFVLSQMASLSRRGHEISVLCNEVHSVNPRLFQQGDIDDYVGRTNVWRRSLAGNQFLAKLGGTRGQRLLKFVDDVSTIRNIDRFDAIIAHFGGNGARVARAAFPNRDIPPLLTVFHGYDVGIPHKIGELGRYRRLFKKGSRLLPVNNYFGNLLATAGAPREKITTHHMGIDLASIPFEPKRRTNGPFRILSVARLTEKKGTEYAIRALSQLRSAEPAFDWQYEIVGDGPLQEDLKTLTSQLGVADRVKFLGQMSHAETKERLKNSDLFVLPSVTAQDGDVEGIPVALMEAMAAGVAVLSSIHSGIPELITDGVHGCLAKERDVAGLATAIFQMASNTARTDEMVAAARDKIARDFNNDILDNELEKIIRDVAG